MATHITCPECDASLRLANPVAPGKTLRCPKCGSRFQVPAREVVASHLKEGPRQKTSSAATRRLVEEDERPEDRDQTPVPKPRRKEVNEPSDEEDRTPLPKKRRKKGHRKAPKPQANKALIWSLAGLLILVIGGVITAGVVYLLKGKAPAPQASTTSAQSPPSEDPQKVAAELVDVVNARNSGGDYKQAVLDKWGKLQRAKQTLLPLPGLEKALQAPDHSVREKAAYAMWQIFIHSPDANDSQVTEAIQPLLQCAQESGDGHEDGVYALGTLREFGPRAANTIPDLIQLLHHPSSGTRAAAASALSKVGGSKTQQVTSALMNAEWGEPDPSVRSIEEQTINALTFRGQGASPSRH